MILPYSDDVNAKLAEGRDKAPEAPSPAILEQLSSDDRSIVEGLVDGTRVPLTELSPAQRDRVFEIGLVFQFLAKELSKDDPDLPRVSKELAKAARSLLRQDRSNPNAK